jgi:hypothetical protein
MVRTDGLRVAVSVPAASADLMVVPEDPVTMTVGRVWDRVQLRAKPWVGRLQLVEGALSISSMPMPPAARQLEA